MNISIFSKGKEYFSASRAGEITGYSSDYIGQLCRSGKIDGELVGRTWYVDLEALQVHKKVRQLGKPSHKIVFGPDGGHGSSSLQSSYKAVSGGPNSFTPLPTLLKTVKPIPSSTHSSRFSLKKLRNLSLSSLALVLALVMTGGAINLTSPHVLKSIESGNGKISEILLANFEEGDWGEFAHTLVASVSFSDLITESWRKVTGVVTDLFASDEPEILPAYKPPRLVEEGPEEIITTTAVTTPAPSIDLGNLRRELLRDVEVYLNSRITPSTPAPSVVYQSGPTFNTTVFRSDILTSDTQPAIRQQSEVDSERNALSIAGILDGGEFINASITSSTGSFSTLSGTTFSFGNATGTSLYLSGNAEVDGNLNVGLNTVTLGQLISTRVPTLAHVFTPSWPSGTSNASDATIYINPASADPDTNIFAAAVNGQVKFLVDAEGDVYANNMILSGSTSAGETNIAGNLSVQDNSTFGDASTDTTTFNSQLLARASTTLQNFTFTNATGTSATTTNFFSTTGTFTFLFSNTSNLTESGNLFWTDNRFDARLSATTTLPNLTTLLGLTDIIVTRSTTTNATTTNLAVSGSSQLGTIISGLWNGTAIGDSYLTKSGDWTGTFDNQEGTYYLARANHTGTQLASTISDFAAAADLRINATTTIGTLTTLLGLTDTITTRATTTNATSTNFFSTTASSTNLFSSVAAIGGNAFNVISGGNVGIGTTNPGSLLDVRGEVRIAQSGNVVGSTPKLQFITGNTSARGYIQSDANVLGDMRIQTEGGQALQLNPVSGNVGIGTTNPGGLLDAFSSTSRYIRYLPTSGLADFEIVSNNNVQPIFSVKGTGTADLVNVFDNTTEVFTILDGGNVGIGTTNPGSILDIRKDSSAALGADINLRNLTTSSPLDTATGITGYLADSSSVAREAGRIRFFSNRSGGWGASGTWDAGISFWTNSGTGLTEKVRIDHSGYVGIGTTNPSTQLHIESGSPSVRTVRTGASARSYEFGVGTGPNVAGTSFTIVDRTANEERLTILSSGNVGVGTTNPGYRFTVDARSGSPSYNGLYVIAGGNSSGSYTAYFEKHSEGASMTLRGDGFPWVNQAWSVGSDRRLKENIVYLEGGGLDKVLNLKPVSFDYITGGKNNLGFVAQDVQEVIPEAVLVGNAETGMLSVKSDFIIPHLVNAVKEIYAEFIEFKNIVLAYTEYFFTREVETKLLCISNDIGEKTCITKEELDALLASAGRAAQPTTNNSQSSTETTTETTASTSPETTETAPEPATTEEPTPEPVVESTAPDEPPVEEETTTTEEVVESTE